MSAVDPLARSLLAGVRAAAARLAPHLPPSPVLTTRLPDHGAEPVHLKLENLQPTGSFKVRGALNKVLGLSAAARERGVVAASTGNHGRAVAYALGLAGGRGAVYLPTTTPANKVAALRASGLEVVAHGDDCGATEVEARAVAAARGQTYVSPYNDPEVLAGQGTIGLELLAQCPDLGAVLVAVGGGGLIAGIGAVIKALRPEVQVIGCWAANSPVMHRCMQAGAVVPVDELPTLADATAGGLEPGAITVEPCRRFVDRAVFVDEAAIRAAIRTMFTRHGMVVEGAAGVALAAHRQLAAQLADELGGRRAAVVVCGANLALPKLLEILGEAPAGG